jgi:Asp-tRNA(Asn)/Glu-tRNA(Gln) amidotransferase A subunit family amidase
VILKIIQQRAQVQKGINLMSSETDAKPLDGVALAGLIRDGELSAQELYDQTTARVEKVNGRINAVVEELDEVATNCLAGKWRNDSASPSSLAGVPTYLKALFSACEGAPLTASSKTTAGMVAPFDSAVTRRLKQAGCVIAGMTNSPEFGINTSTEGQYYGAAKNPWDLSLSTGGSSGGAAAAVAAGIVPVAHATDGGGSIRIPASCCGLVGLKPSRGRVSAGPAAGESTSGLSYVNAVSRSVRDSAAFLDVVSGEEPGDPYTAPPNPRPFLEEAGRDPGKLRIGLCERSFNNDDVHGECLDAVREAARLCEGLGLEITPIEPAHDTEIFWPIIERVFAANVAQSLSALGGMRDQPIGEDEIERNTMQMWEKGKAISAMEFIGTQAHMNLVSRQTAGLFAEVDLILTPTMAVPEIPLGYLDTMIEDRSIFDARITPTTAFTALFNVTGMPAISVPVVTRANGNPIGVQFAAPYCGEATLIRLASQLEEAHPWAHRRPAVFAD